MTLLIYKHIPNKSVCYKIGSDCIDNIIHILPLCKYKILDIEEQNKKTILEMEKSGVDYDTLITCKLSFYLKSKLNYRFHVDIPKIISAYKMTYCKTRDDIEQLLIADFKEMGVNISQNMESGTRIYNKLNQLIGTLSYDLLEGDLYLDKNNETIIKYHQNLIFLTGNGEISEIRKKISELNQIQCNIL